MENYVPSDREDLIESSPPYPSQFTDGVIIKIKKNTKFGKILDYVRKQFNDETVRHIIFEGVGDAADKCISCVEVFKRNSQILLYQWNALETAKKTVFWDPIIENLDTLKVTIEIPVMYILISKDVFPVEFQCLSMQSTEISGEKPSTAKRNPKKRPRGSSTNNWARPDRGESGALAGKRQAILDEIKADD